MIIKNLLWIGAIAGLTACGDDATVTPDASTAIDAPVVDIDAAPDAPLAPFVAPTAFSIPLSAAGPDQMQSAVGGPGGTFYAAGFAAQTLAGPKFVTVVKTGTTGPIAAFGTGGVKTTTFISATGSADEIDVAVQPSGKLIVTATVANAIVGADRDIVVFRLDGTTGELDTTFGTGGSTIINLNDAIDSTQAAQRDVSRGLAIGPGGVIYIHGGQRRADVAATTDSDFAVVRLSVDGIVDPTFGTAGKFTLDIQNANATPRGIKVLDDGSIIATGYANTPGVGSTQVVLYKLTPAGALDAAFGTGGLFHEVVLTTQTEAYNAAIHGNTIVTAGYGRNTGDTNDYISLRFNATTGVRDLTWGGAAATDGKVFFDPSGAMLGSNCRNAIALPNGKTLLLGSTGPSNMATQDAVFAVLDANGVLDTAYGDGVHTYPLGANLNDQFWGGAVSGDNALIVGYKGGGATQDETVNDDSWGVILPLR